MATEHDADAAHEAAGQGRTASILASIRAAEDQAGRLPAVDLSGVDVFPFEGPLTVRRIGDPFFRNPRDAAKTARQIASPAALSSRVP